MINKLLTDLGLSDKEAKMYIVALQSGTQAISYHAKKAHMNRGTAYVILHELLKKGLVVQSTKSNIQYFTALEPQHLIAFVEHKENELATQKKRIEKMMSSFLALKNPFTMQPKIQFFDGVEGARMVLEDTLNSQEKQLCAFLSIFDIAEFTGADFFHDYTNRRIQLGYELKALRTLEKDRQAFEADIHSQHYVTSRKEKREIRYIPDDLAFPVSIYMYDQKLAIIGSKEENFALLIESRELANMQKKLFEMIWKTAKVNISK